MANCIILCTAQHTGTWFLIDLFRKHSEVKHEIINCADIRNNGRWPFPKDAPFLSDVGREKTIIHFHLNNAQHGQVVGASTIEIDELIQEYGATFTMRDPLRALITRDAKHPSLNHAYIVDGISYIASRYYILIWPNMIIPIDCPSTHSIKDVFMYWGLSYEPQVAEYVSQWTAPVYNLSPDTPLKQAYKEKDTRYIAKHLKEWAYLQTKEEMLRPMLEDLGYRDLLWWTA